MPKPVIYISSTFIDLEEHRKVLIGNLLKTECFDVIGMENYGTKSQRPLDKCLTDVERAEFYILLLGMRYGFVPKESASGFSITHLEYKKAIGDGNDKVIAGDPNYIKCVLPFFIDKDYLFPEAINKIITDEPSKNKDNLEQLKDKIRLDFTMESAFTSPADLAMKVLSALIPELVKRNYAALVKKLVFPEEIIYRCNRDVVRNDFLSTNYHNKDFYRLYIIHGEIPELPLIFSNNLSNYELNSIENSVIYNLEDYLSIDAGKFLIKLVRDIYYNIIRSWPEGHQPMLLLRLAQDILSTDRFADTVIKFNITYAAWMIYKRYLEELFKKINETNAQLTAPNKRFYIFMNVNYSSSAEKVREKSNFYMLLGRLSDIRGRHIEQWVRTYLFMNKDKKISAINMMEELSLRVKQRYFPELEDNMKALTMSQTIDRLRKIVRHFNKNEDIFDDYNNMFN